MKEGGYSCTCILMDILVQPPSPPPLREGGGGCYRIWDSRSQNDVGSWIWGVKKCGIWDLIWDLALISWIECQSWIFLKKFYDILRPIVKIRPLPGGLRGHYMPPRGYPRARRALVCQHCLYILTVESLTVLPRCLYSNFIVKFTDLHILYVTVNRSWWYCVCLDLLRYCIKLVSFVD